jgi:hypothetical protein
MEFIFTVNFDWKPVIDEQEAKNVSDAQLPGRQCFWY